jgi:muramoyltetrapeptide carboxypeptidase
MNADRRRCWNALPLGVIAACALVATSRAEENAPIKPAGLKPGDTIALVAPAGEVDLKALARARQRLEARGYHVLVSDTIARRRGYLAGDDRRRADELVAAFANPEVDAVVSIAGGYGTTRILDLLDYDVIAANPKIFTGFSDITGLHLAIAARCNFITFHSPNGEAAFGGEKELPEFHSHYLWTNLLADDENEPFELSYEAPNDEMPIRSVRPGIARGRISGGNLSLVAALIGTPYEVRSDGRVLFLEDINEQPYRIDRMLSQLRLAGILQSPAAVVLGAYHKCEPDDEDPSLTLDEVFNDYFGDAPYPVIKNVPCGHGPWNATLPIGALAEVDGDKATLKLLERPVR